jgi:hypothetical protein
MFDEHHEKMDHLKTTLVVQTSRPVFLRTFQDDIFGVWRGSYDDLATYLDGVNHIDDRFHIKYNISQYQIKFLDLTISKGPRFKSRGLLDVRVYQKEVSNFLYIPFTSFHTLQIKNSFIRTELDRYATHNSSPMDYMRAKYRFRRRLRHRGYPRKLIQKVFDSHYHSKRATLLRQRMLPSRASKRIPLLFKTTHSSRHDKLGLKAFLMAAHKEIKKVPSLADFHSKPPIVCLKRAKNLYEVLRPS